MADRAREALDAYAARSAGDDAGNSIGTLGDVAPEAIAALRAVLAYSDDLDKIDLYAAPAFRLRTTIRTALEARK